MSDDSLEEQLDKLEEAAHSGDAQSPIVRLLPIIIPLVALPILVVAGAFFINSEPEPKVVAKIPVLSDEGLVKIAPADTGGIKIPDQDKAVYDPMKQGSGDDTDTQVMPPPEAPMKPPEGGADLASAIPPPPGTMEPILPPPGANGEAGALDLPTMPSPGGAAVLPTPPEGAKVATVPPSNGKSVIVPPPAASLKVPETAMATKTPAAMANPKIPEKAPTMTAGKAASSPPSVTTQVVATAQTASLAKNYRVQIQSLNSQSQAEKAWDSWVKKHPDLLGDLSLTVQRAVIKDRGTYYRVQAGPFADHKKADDVCRKLKNRGQDCLVIRP